MMQTRKCLKVLNTLAVLVLAGCGAWLYVVRGRIIASFNVSGQATTPARTWRAVEAEGIDWSGEIRMGAVRVQTIDLGKEDAQAIMNRRETEWLANGWQRIEHDGPPSDTDIATGARVFRKEERYRVLANIKHPHGGQEFLMRFEMDGNQALRDFNGEFEIETFLESQSADLPGIPAPPNARRLFSLVDAHGGGIVSYSVERARSRPVYEGYLRNMKTIGWQPLPMGIREGQMTMLTRGSKLCLIGWNDSASQDRSFITVVHYGN